MNNKIIRYRDVIGHSIKYRACSYIFHSKFLSANYTRVYKKDHFFAPPNNAMLSLSSLINPLNQFSKRQEMN